MLLPAGTSDEDLLIFPSKAPPSDAPCGKKMKRVYIETITY
jgi:hypothetical protein